MLVAARIWCEESPSFKERREAIRPPSIKNDWPACKIVAPALSVRTRLVRADYKREFAKPIGGGFRLRLPRNALKAEGERAAVMRRRRLR